jgi:hypothetical protein
VNKVHHIGPLILMSAGITFACLTLVRFLDLERPPNKPADSSEELPDDQLSAYYLRGANDT